MMKINLDAVPPRTAEEIASIVEAELAHIEDHRLADALRQFLVSPPRMEMRCWGWSHPIRDFPTWVVAESARYDYGIVHSDYGFGPAMPWGLVFSSQDNFGADSGWYQHLFEAFLESRLIEEFNEDDMQTVLTAAAVNLFRSDRPE